MKIRAIVILTIITVLSFCGCGNKEKDSSLNTETTSSYIEDETSEEQLSEVITSEEITTTYEEIISTTEETTIEESESESIEETTENVETTTKKTVNKTTKNTTKKTSNSDNKEETTTSIINQGPLYEFYKNVEKILAEIIRPDMNELDKVMSIHEYIRLNIRYDYENYINNTIPVESYYAFGALKNGVAVCSGYAELFYEMATMAGIEAIVVEGYSAYNNVGHAWNQVKIDGNWYNLDVCWDDTEATGFEYQYCLIGDDEFYESHIPVSHIYACTKGFDESSLIKSIIKISNDDSTAYAANKEELYLRISEMVSKGKTEFYIYVPCVGFDFNYMYEAFDKVKKPFEPLGTPFQDNHMRYHIELMENAYVVENASDLDKIFTEQSDNIEDIILWYYDEAIISEESAFEIINNQYP